MNPEIEALGKRAVACPGWRWLPRMVDQYGNTVLVVADGVPVEWVDLRGNYVDLVSDRRTGEARGFWVTSIPDIPDPATLGCLLALVREAWADPGLTPVFRYGVWELFSKSALVCSPREATEAAAIVAALEAAPAREATA